MQIIPAIDIRNGKCVRLTQGDFAQEKIYGDDPVGVAREWEKQGATFLHIVDLDGAKSGKPVNFPTIKKIAKAIKIPIQVGGGIRNKKTVSKLLAAGISRVILGTVALEDEEELQSILKEFSSKVAIGLDAKKGKLMTRGWLKEENVSVVTTAIKLEKLGAKRFIYTDIDKDGTLTLPNYKETSNLINSVSVPVIASGGISTIETIKKLKKLGAEGAIVGKALYEKTITLKEAINAG